MGCTHTSTHYNFHKTRIFIILVAHNTHLKWEMHMPKLPSQIYPLKNTCRYAKSLIYSTPFFASLGPSMWNLQTSSRTTLLINQPSYVQDSFSDPLFSLASSLLKHHPMVPNFPQMDISYRAWYNLQYYLGFIPNIASSSQNNAGIPMAIIPWLVFFCGFT